MGDPQGDLRPGTPILVGFFTEISKKWVLDSKSLRISLYVEPPRGGGVGGEQFRANFDDLRPLKAKFGTFEHLWGSKTQFRVPQFLVGFTENKSIFGPKKKFF